MQNGADEGQPLGVVSGSETLAEGPSAGTRKKFEARRDRALAIIMLGVDPSLLYILGNPEDPAVVWKKLEDQFQRKTWSNRLQLRRKLFSLNRDGVRAPAHKDDDRSFGGTRGDRRPRGRGRQSHASTCQFT